MLMNRAILFHIILVSISFVRCTRGNPAPVIQLDQFGQGSISGIPISGTPVSDSGPGGYFRALTYRLPFTGVQGDVFVTDPNFSDLTLEIIRFNGDGTVIFYAGNLPGSRAFVPSPPTSLYYKRATTSDVGSEDSNSATYVPTAGQPGFDASGPSYIFYNGVSGLLYPPTISLNFGASSIPFNASTTLSFTISNSNSTVTLTGIGFSDTLPAGLVIATPNGLSTNCGGIVTALPGSGSVSLSGATLNPGTCSVSVNVSGTSTGVKNNNVQVISTNGGIGNTATAGVTVNAVDVGKSPTSLGGTLTGKTGPQNGRVWSFTITNPGPGAALSAQATSFTLTQTSGAACTPVVNSPKFPVALGDIAPAGSAPLNVTIDFTGCAGTAKFKLSVPLTANSGAATGNIVRLNEFR
jgi:hypothetical protein